MTPAERWRLQLEAWRIPDELLDAVEDSPYGWPQALWKRRSRAAIDEPEPRTLQIVRDLLGQFGSLLDVGAGRGRASLPLAAEGNRLTAVEPDPGMASGLREDAAARGVAVEVIEGSWPEVSASVEPVDVAMSAHVVYDVHEIIPFLAAMQKKARGAVVIELSDRHPWAGLAPHYRVLHGLERPDGPTADDLIEVVSEMLERPPQVERWHRSGGLHFESIDEIREMFGRRLVLPRNRWEELDDVLEAIGAVVDGSTGSD